MKIHRKCNRSVLKRPRLERFHCENIVRADFGVTFQNLLQHLSGESDHCENTVHEEGRGGGGGGGGEGEELAVRKKNKNPTQRMWGIIRAHLDVTFQNLLQHLSGESDHYENT